MNRVIVSYNGKSINDTTNYHTRLLDQTQAEADPILVERTDNPPVYAGKSYNGKILNLAVDLKGTSDNHRGLKLGTINGWLNVHDRDTHALIITDASNGNKQWYVNATTVRQTEINGNLTQYQLIAADPVWRSVNTTSATLSMTGASGTLTITPGGNQDAYPIITITPTGAKTGGYAYKRWVPIYNRTNEAITDAWNLTDNGTGTAVWNTAALVSGGTVQADGDDMRVIIDSVEANRWITGLGSATTKIHAVVPLSPKIEFTAAVMTGTATTGTLTVQAKAANTLALRRLPDSGILMWDAEAVSYSAVNKSNMNSLSVVLDARGIRGTTGGTHAAGATMRWIEHDTWLMYGNSSATAPETDDNEKPVFDIINSNNLNRVYAEFSGSARQSGAWKPAVLVSTGGLSYTYTQDHNEDIHKIYQPAECLGLAMVSWSRGVRAQSESARLEWRYDSPIGITAVALSGSMYSEFSHGTLPASTSPRYWPGTVAIQRSPDGRTYANVYSLGTTPPGTAATWQAWDSGSINLGGTFDHIRLFMGGAIAAVEDSCAKVEAGAGTIYQDSAAIPVITMGAQQTGYYLDAEIRNNTTGEYMGLTGPVELNKALTVDTDARTVEFSDGTNMLGMRKVPAGQTQWLRLLPGVANQIVITDTGTSGVTIVMTYEDRST